MVRLKRTELDGNRLPEKAGFLTVHPPNSGGAKRAFFPLPVCTTSRVDLTVRRVAAGF